MSIQSIDKEYIAGTYNRFPVEIVSGKGSLVYDETGREYIDMGSGIGVTSFGIADEAWQQAIIAQISQVQHMSNLYYTQPCALLAKLLCEKTGMKKVFFSNSGAEANECAIKVARKYAVDKYGPQRYIIVTLTNSFHGRTLTTLAATGQDHYHELFQPLTPGFVSVDAGDLETLQYMATQGKVAGVLMECSQGEGGVVPMEEDYLKAVRALCTERDVLMMLDEVQTGIGRTGYFFSYQRAGILPDVVTAAKGLGGGLPIGVCIAGEKVKDSFAPGMNGSTFGANPVVCAGAVEVVSRVSKPEFLKEVQEKGEYFKERLLKMPNVEFVRGRGMMIGVKVKDKDAHDVLNACAKAGLLILTAKDLVRFLPPLTITKEEIDAGLAIFAEQIK